MIVVLGIFDIIVEENEKKGFYLNSSKSSTMVFSMSTNTLPSRITVHGQSHEQISTVIYLGLKFTSDASAKQRIGIAKSTFSFKGNILKDI